MDSIVWNRMIDHAGDAESGSSRQVRHPPIVISDSRTLVRQCLLATVMAADRATPFVGVAEISHWVEMGGERAAALVLLCLPGGLSFEAERAMVAQALLDLSQLPEQPPLAILSDREVPSQIVEIIRLGARGYIPTSASVEVAMRALQLVQAGDTYIPASSLCAFACSPQPAIEQAATSEIALFPPRQLSVARALRKGTPNKIIAYELNMCESTVKVHVRNIMKKLKARNRTEVAFLMNQHFEAERHI